MKEKYRVTFELVNGKSQTYDLENTTKEAIYGNMLVNSPDGWIELESKGEIHYIKADKIVSVKLLSESAKKVRQDKTVKAVQGIRF